MGSKMGPKTSSKTRAKIIPKNGFQNKPQKRFRNKLKYRSNIFKPFKKRAQIAYGTAAAPAKIIEFLGNHTWCKV